MRLDLHVHTSHSSDCGESVEDIVRHAREKLDGIAITDHNEIAGALEAHRLWENVIVGEEIETDEGEVIAYHIQEKIIERDIEEAIDKVKSQGGLVGVSHPFDFIRKNAVKKKTLERVAHSLDFIEAANARSLFPFNARARDAASRLGKKMIAGSDAHFAWEVGNAWTEADIGLREVVGIHLEVSPLYPLTRLTATKLYKIGKGRW